MPADGRHSHWLRKAALSPPRQLGIAQSTPPPLNCVLARADMHASVSFSTDFVTDRCALYCSRFLQAGQIVSPNSFPEDSSCHDITDAAPTRLSPRPIFDSSFQHESGCCPGARTTPRTCQTSSIDGLRTRYVVGAATFLAQPDAGAIGPNRRTGLELSLHGHIR